MSRIAIRSSSYAALLAAASVSLVTSLACSSSDARPVSGASANTASVNAPSAISATAPATQSNASRTPNELGRIPILEYHLIGERESRWSRNYDRFRKDLDLLYTRGYRPVTITQILDRKVNLPKGLSPVVLVFDDASPGQFSYIERSNGQLDIDPNSAVGILLAFNKRHPDWTNSAVFCMLSAAGEGHAFFGEKNIKGQKSAWRFPKVQFLAKQGFELCNHTLWHANLGKYPDPFVQEQIARGQMAIDSAVPGYKVRTFALPLGVWPKNKQLAWSGSWTDPKTSKVARYNYEAVLEVSGGPTRSPYDPKFNPRSMNRVEVFGNELERVLDQLDKPGPNGRYVSDGDQKTIAKP